jgi:hypothetical protein
MTSVTADIPADISADHEAKLRRCYAVLKELAGECEVPSVRAAARMALAELFPALDGQALDFEFYSHRWTVAEAELRRDGRRR